MTKDANTRYRKRISEKIDNNLLEKVEDISQKLDIPKSRIFEDSIEYIIHKELDISFKKCVRCPKNRSQINLTINSALWYLFKSYAKENKYKLVDLLEFGLKYSTKKFQKKIKQNNDIYSKIGCIKESV
jgi:hypothetical protein